MKRRNLLLALALLALFAAGGVAYFRAFVVQKPFGIILFTGEGLVSSRLAAARLYDGGADQLLTLEKLPHLALLSTHANDLAVSDAAAAASALATGKKVNQRALAVDPNGRPLPSLLEIARERGRAVGLVTSGSLTDPTPAAFFAHAIDSRDREGLAAQLIDKAGINVVLGGGGANFLPELKGGARRDARDLVLDATGRNGYTLVRTGAELAAVPTWRGPRLLGLFADDVGVREGPAAPAVARDESTRPPLAELTRRAIEILQREGRGYLLVVDAGLAARASEANRGERALQELIELDRAVGVALQYAAGNNKTLIVAAGTVATGGMALNGYPLRQDRGVSLLGINVNGLPSLTWATGPNGVRNAEGGTRNEDPADPAPADAKPPAPRPPTAPEPAAFAAPVAANTADETLAIGFGPGSERLGGFLDNTFIFEMIRDQL